MFKTSKSSVYLPGYPKSIIEIIQIAEGAKYMKSWLIKFKVSLRIGNRNAKCACRRQVIYRSIAPMNSKWMYNCQRVVTIANVIEINITEFYLWKYILCQQLYSLKAFNNESRFSCRVRHKNDSSVLFRLEKLVSINGNKNCVSVLVLLGSVYSNSIMT